MAKQRTLKHDEVTAGRQVVVGDFVGTTIYYVREVNEQGAHLEYELDTPDRKRVSGGWVPRGMCMVPTAAQIAADEKGRPT